MWKCLLLGKMIIKRSAKYYKLFYFTKSKMQDGGYWFLPFLVLLYALLRYYFFSRLLNLNLCLFSDFKSEPGVLVNAQLRHHDDFGIKSFFAFFFFSIFRILLYSENPFSTMNFANRTGVKVHSISCLELRSFVATVCKNPDYNSIL